MRDGQPSRTALGAAVHRAVHQDLDGAAVFRDPLAWRIVGLDRDTVLADEKLTGRARLRTFVAVRHRFAEDSLAAAVARGVRQVVVLGAGLDTFAYRNPFPATTVYEVDHPATGAWKQERLAAAGIAVPDNVRYVAVDFERDDLLERLADAGLDRTRPAFFLWLGVVPYLSRDAIRGTLAAVASIPGAEVVFDYVNPPERLPESSRAGHADLRGRVAALGEPLREGIDTTELHELLRSVGFTEIEDLDRPQIRARYLGRPPGVGSGGAHVLRARACDRSTAGAAYGRGMSSQSGPEYDAATARQVHAATEQAVHATATAYTRDASIDVEQRLRSELAAQGLDVDDDQWIAEVAHQVRSGHRVVFEDPNRPGSLGGDNGGG